ncbi:hypothetical protein B0H13DRAFT_326768 [Mycena leptocephala]|nr:hypothetical protein B0H13DRAFT_326768 [Mycena leptocephala]
MDPSCITANPDISGIGVRTAIYAQNLLCFIPVVAYLWDGTVSRDEMKGIKDQSISMLAIAFAILISTIIQATTAVEALQITRFHVAVILDLSWMNNTGTWIWFLLYAHRLSKADEGGQHRRPIPATWSAWTPVIFSSRHVRDRTLSHRRSRLGPVFAGTRAHPWFLPPRAHGCHWNLALAGSSQIRHHHPLRSNAYYRWRRRAFLVTNTAGLFVGDVFPSPRPWHQSSPPDLLLSRTSYRIQPVSATQPWVLGSMYPKYPSEVG